MKNLRIISNSKYRMFFFTNGVKYFIQVLFFSDGYIDTSKTVEKTFNTKELAEMYFNNAESQLYYLIHK